MLELNYLCIIETLLFMIFGITKANSEDYVIENDEIKYKNPFIYNITDANFTNIVNKDEDNIFNGWDSSCIYVILFFALIFVGIKFLINVISKQIKEEMRNDYLLI